MSNLPVKKGDDFIGEFEVMDLSELKDKQFMIAVNAGEREAGRFVCQSLKGPFTYYEMLEEVGQMYRNHQHHAKVYFCEKKRDVMAKWLDTNTIDYIEAHWDNLVVEGLLDGGLDDEVKDYTCMAGVNEAEAGDDPLTVEDDGDDSQ